MARPLRTIEAQAASLGPAASGDVPAKAASNRATDELAKRAAVTENAKHPFAAAKAEIAQNEAPPLQLENQADREVAAAKPSVQNRDGAQPDALNQRAASGAQAVMRNYAPASPQAPAEQNEAPAEAPEAKNLAARNQVAEKASADAVSRWRQSAEDAQTPEERVAALKQLLVAAQAAGDVKTVKLAQQALKVAEAQNVARKRAENLQATPPALRAKAAPSQGSGELKAQKSKN